MKQWRSRTPAAPRLEDLFDRADWQEHGACQGIDPDLFFPERGESTAEAKAICTTCPVRDECLEFALTHNEKFGIWGGTSERDRKRIRKQRGEARLKETA